jgi:hypothetical protein
MTPKFKLHESLENAFIVGLLLTRSVQRAETAVLDSVKPPCPDDLYSEALFRRVILHSIDMQSIEPPRRQQKELEEAASILPFELQCVLNLSTNLRHCYVLRILVGLNRDVCSWLLHLDTSQVDEYTCAAMLELPLVQERASCRRGAAPSRNYFEDHLDVAVNVRRVTHAYTPRNQEIPTVLLTNTKIINIDRRKTNP